MFDYGEGVTKDREEAMRLYRLAAEQGVALASMHLTRLAAE
jgi:TPR repeat protein